MSGRPTLAASATLFDRIDERVLRAAEDGTLGRAEKLCDTLADLGGLRPEFCDWRDRNRQTRQASTKAGNCGCGGHAATADPAGRLARAEQAQTELAELLVRLLMPSVIAGHQPAPRRLGGWPPGYVPPNTGWLR